MDKVFRSQVERLKEIDEELARLLVRHDEYEDELKKLDRRKFRTQDEESRVKVIKIAKARGKEQMVTIASRYQEAA